MHRANTNAIELDKILKQLLNGKLSTCQVMTGRHISIAFGAGCLVPLFPLTTGASQITGKFGYQIRLINKHTELIELSAFPKVNYERHNECQL